MRPRARPVLPLALALYLAATATATAMQTAHMSARFTPERLGSATTVSLAFSITTPALVPAPLKAIELAYPANLGFATSGLGVAACDPAALEELGAVVCPPNSRMGTGSADAEIPIGPTLVREPVTLELFAGPSPDGRLHLLVYASGKFPVYAQVVLPGVLLAGRLQIVVPPIPSLPAGPYVAIADMRLTLGGRLTYYARVGPSNVAYHPPGVGLPPSCPRGGFPFTATFAFLDGSSSLAHTAVACPRHR